MVKLPRPITSMEPCPIGAVLSLVGPMFTNQQKDNLERQVSYFFKATGNP